MLRVSEDVWLADCVADAVKVWEGLCDGDWVCDLVMERVWEGVEDRVRVPVEDGVGDGDAVFVFDGVKVAEAVCVAGLGFVSPILSASGFWFGR